VLIFSNSDAKTDNFKVRERSFGIGGVKFYDRNMDGYQDPGEALLSNWRIDVAYTLRDGTQGVATTHTDMNGRWSLLFRAGTTFTACEVIPDASWVQTAPIPGSVISGTNIVADTPNAGSARFNQRHLRTGFRATIRVHDPRHEVLRSEQKWQVGFRRGCYPGFKIVIDATLPDGNTTKEALYTNRMARTPHTSRCTPVHRKRVQPNSDWYQSGPLNGATTADYQAKASIGEWEGVVGTADTTGLDFFNYCMTDTPGYGGHTKGLLA
jgi:hypothetical protein